MKKLLRLLILIFNLLLLINIYGKVQIITSKELLNVDDEISSEYGSNEEWMELSKKINNVFTSVYNSRDLHFDNKIESANQSSKSLHYKVNPIVEVDSAMNDFSLFKEELLFNIKSFSIKEQEMIESSLETKEELITAGYSYD